MYTSKSGAAFATTFNDKSTTRNAIKCTKLVESTTTQFRLCTRKSTMYLH